MKRRTDAPTAAPPGAPADGPGDAALAFIDEAVTDVAERLPAIDTDAMRLVLLLHRVTNAIVYDIESTVHRPAGWSWSAFRALFTLWVSGACEPSRLAELSGMSRQAVSALAKTLEHDGLIRRTAATGDARSVVLSLTPDGSARLERAFVGHNVREQQWAGVLAPAQRSELTSLLAALADATHEPWVSHRDDPHRHDDGRQVEAWHDSARRETTTPTRQPSRPAPSPTRPSRTPTR